MMIVTDSFHTPHQVSIGNSFTLCCSSWVFHFLKIDCANVLLETRFEIPVFRTSAYNRERAFPWILILVPHSGIIFKTIILIYKKDIMMQGWCTSPWLIYKYRTGPVRNLNLQLLMIENKEVVIWKIICPIQFQHARVCIIISFVENLSSIHVTLISR